jgi:steroid delta-isomerase-like uncharacterized protein
MKQDVRSLSIRWFEEVWNQRRAEVIDELWAEDAIGHIEGLEGEVTRDDFKVHHTDLLRALPDMHFRLGKVMVDGNESVVEWEVTGHHTGEGLGSPPTGRLVRFKGVTWMVWEGGRIAGGWDKWNRGKVIQRLARVDEQEVIHHYGLTAREAEVAFLMAERATHKEIAKELGIKPNTARRHCERVLQKLDVHWKGDVEAALLRAHREGAHQHT